MLILTIINSLLILILFVKPKKYFELEFKKETTSINKTLLGFRIILWKKLEYGSKSVVQIYIPVNNNKKVELAEEVSKLLADNVNRSYTLRAKFSWLRTTKEVEQFEKDYSVVDKKLVESLVSNFKPKNQL